MGNVFVGIIVDNGAENAVQHIFAGTSSESIAYQAYDAYVKDAWDDDVHGDKSIGVIEVVEAYFLLQEQEQLVIEEIEIGD